MLQIEVQDYYLIGPKGKTLETTCEMRSKPNELPSQMLNWNWDTAKKKKNTQKIDNFQREKTDKSFSSFNLNLTQLGKWLEANEKQKGCNQRQWMYKPN